MGTITVDAGTVLPYEMHNLIVVVRKSVEYMDRYRIQYPTAFVLAHLDLSRPTLSDGFIKAVQQYVWHNDSSLLTKALKRDCDDAMKQMCKISVKFDKKQ